MMINFKALIFISFVGAFFLPSVLQAEQITMQCDGTVLRYEKGFWSSPKITYRDDAQWKPYCFSGLTFKELGAVCQETVEFEKLTFETFKVDGDYIKSEIGKLSEWYKICIENKEKDRSSYIEQSDALNRKMKCQAFERNFNITSDKISLDALIQRYIPPLNEELTREAGTKAFVADKTTYVDFYLKTLETTYKSEESGGPSGGTTTCEVIE